MKQSQLTSISLKPDLQSEALNKLRPFHQLDYNVICPDLLAVKNVIKNC